MHGPPNLQTGRGMLMAGGIILILALWMSVGRGEWLQSGLWYALAIFLVTFGSLMSDATARWRRVLLVVGLASGMVAFGFALWLVMLRP